MMDDGVGATHGRACLRSAGLISTQSAQEVCYDTSQHTG